MNSLVFRPRTATEIVDATFRICRAHYGALVTVMIVINAPALLLAMFPPTARLAEVISNMLFTVADGAVIAIVSAVYLGRSAEAGVGFRALEGRVGSLIGASIIRGLAIILGLILLIVPGLYLIAATFAIPMVIVVEGNSAGESFTRSQRLIAGHFWHVARTLALLGAIVFGLFIGVAAVLGIMWELFPGGETLFDMLLNISLVLLYPLFSVGGTLLYYDLRIRTEGFDLEMMLDSLNPKSATTAGAAAAL